MPGNARKGEMKPSKYGQSNNSGSGEVDWERAGGGGGGAGGRVWETCMVRVKKVIELMCK